jgi:hypothetical protein
MRDDQQLLAGLCSARSLQDFAAQRDAVRQLSDRYVGHLLEAAAAVMAARIRTPPLQV